MKKCCEICEHSVEVKYKLDSNYYNRTYLVLFCIAAPPTQNNREKFNWRYMITGHSKLEKYYKYPIVGGTSDSSYIFSEVAPCSFYCITKNKKKIEKYEERLKAEKKEEEVKEKEQKQRLEEVKKEQLRIKVRREKVKAEELKKKKRRKYQKEYRARKKALLEEERKEKNKYNRFEIMDVD